MISSFPRGTQHFRPNYSKISLKLISNMTSLNLFFSFILALISVNHVVVSLTVTTATSKEHLTYDWTIKDFSLLSQKKGEYIESPIFCTANNDVEWKLRLFPQSDTIKDFVGLFLYLHSRKSPEIMTKVHYELSIIKSNASKYMREFDYTYEKPIGHGSYGFWIRSDLLGIAGPDDTFTIRAEIDIPMTAVNVTEPLEQELLHDLENGRLNEHFAQLFKEPKFSDVVVVVSNETFLAHKNILASRSPVFAAIFQAEESKENWTNEVKIEDMLPVVVKAMLEFIYTDEVADLEALTSGLSEVADKFQLPRLKTMCEIVIYRTLNEDNAADLLILTDLYHSNKLKEHVMKFIANHLAGVMKSEGYGRIEESYTKLLKELLRAIVYRDPKI